tara:strand:- start:235 stop:471 length:237 start_codon:yes stop_codon:yes gene_type:complete
VFCRQLNIFGTSSSPSRIAALLHFWMNFDLSGPARLKMDMGPHHLNGFGGEKRNAKRREWEPNFVNILDLLPQNVFKI